MLQKDENLSHYVLQGYILLIKRKDFLQRAQEQYHAPTEPFTDQSRNLNSTSIAFYKENNKELL